MNLEKLCPNLSFTVESKMGNPYKKKWSQFKLNINYWDIPFPKILRAYQALPLGSFTTGENGLNPLVIPQRFWSRGPEDTYF